MENRNADVPRPHEILVNVLRDLSTFPVLAAELKKVRSPEADRAGAALARVGERFTALVEQLRASVRPVSGRDPRTYEMLSPDELSEELRHALAELPLDVGLRISTLLKLLLADIRKGLPDLFARAKKVDEHESLIRAGEVAQREAVDG